MRLHKFLLQNLDDCQWEKKWTGANWFVVCLVINHMFIVDKIAQLFVFRQVKLVLALPTQMQAGTAKVNTASSVKISWKKWKPNNWNILPCTVCLVDFQQTLILLDHENFNGISCQKNIKWYLKVYLLCTFKNVLSTSELILYDSSVGTKKQIIFNYYSILKFLSLWKSC